MSKHALVICVIEDTVIYYRIFFLIGLTKTERRFNVSENQRCFHFGGESGEGGGESGEG